MTLEQPQHIAELNQQLEAMSPEEGLRFFAENYPGKVVFSTSFSWEDQAITHLIAAGKVPVSLFTLDTGRLFKETYSTWEATMDTYPELRIKTYTPDYGLLQDYLESNGPNAFYKSTDLRKSCCNIRKVEPLRRALAGQAVWVTGLRAEHSPNRQGLPMVEWDEVNGVIKYHPLLHWTLDELKEFVNKNHIPYNSLHDKGFVSIGCLPCTRAIRPGEDFRAGRWWWEDASKKECGLHVHAEPFEKQAQ
ncbi:MAG TPA: phosphoadenylyl-sulfate reductase [Chitinophagaceae bacterium]|jgi:phosphoadenosine phosphosulfate reductase|nr:phosphoadenylyl-sulfate reductase [Chitinophagaceae bacterium]